MRLVDIDDERFWDILFDEACVEGSQAERIKKELENIVSYDADRVIGQIENKMFSAEVYNDDMNGVQIDNLLCFGDVYEILKAGGID